MFRAIDVSISTGPSLGLGNDASPQPFDETGLWSTVNARGRSSMNTIKNIFISITLPLFLGYGAYVVLNSPDPQPDEGSAETEALEAKNNLDSP